MKLRTSRTNFKFILFVTFFSLAICLPVLEDGIEAKINTTHFPGDDLENNSTELSENELELSNSTELLENELEVSNSTELFEIETKINSTEKFEFDDWTEEDESNGKIFRNCETSPVFRMAAPLPIIPQSPY